MWIMNLGKSGEIPKLNEAMAIDLGANMLGEGKICVVLHLIVDTQQRHAGE